MAKMKKIMTISKDGRELSVFADLINNTARIHYIYRDYLTHDSVRGELWKKENFIS